MKIIKKLSLAILTITCLQAPLYAGRGWGYGGAILGGAVVGSAIANSNRRYYDDRDRAEAYRQGREDARREAAGYY